MSNEEWLPETDPSKKIKVVGIDRRPLSERSRLVDRGLVDFRRVCDQAVILDRETDTIRQGKLSTVTDRGQMLAAEANRDNRVARGTANRCKLALLHVAQKQGDTAMKEPGLDGRHRDKSGAKRGEIQQKRSDTLNKNLPRPIPQFSPNATLGYMRKVTGKVSEADVRRTAAKLRK